MKPASNAIKFFGIRISLNLTSEQPRPLKTGSKAARKAFIPHTSFRATVTSINTSLSQIRLPPLIAKHPVTHSPQSSRQ